MSSNGRWRRIKIVEPTPSKPAPSKAKEISGGIKNALDRGEPLEKAKQTFINAGYTPQEVQEAAQMAGPAPVQAAKPLNPEQAPGAPATPTAPAKKTTSKKTIIILSIVGAVVLVAALVIGLFWDKLF